MEFKSSLEKLDHEISKSFARLARGWMAGTPGEMLDGAERIAAARLVAEHLVSSITETDAAFLLTLADPLEAMTDKLTARRRFQPENHHELDCCITSLSAAHIEEGEPGVVTVREFLTQHPGASFEMMTPGGFISLNVEQARGMLAGGSTVGHPGDPEYAMTVSAEELLPQQIQDMNLTHGVWNLLTYCPKQEQDMSMEMQ